MTRYRALLAYDGTGFAGFQRQPDQPTIQAAIEDALYIVTQHRVTVYGAGRTDTGVHASGQVIAFDLDWRHSPHDLRRALNVNLPHAIALRDVQVAKPDFHPRFDARCRCYEYSVYVAEVRDPLKINRAWHSKRSLDVARMQSAAMQLIGTYDFSAFGTPPQGDNPVRTVFRADWQQDKGIYRFTICANAFLNRMVRRIVGTLVAVGQDRMTVEQFQAILASRDLAQAAAPAPPYGLTLVKVEYEDKPDQLPAGSGDKNEE